MNLSEQEMQEAAETLGRLLPDDVTGTPGFMGLLRNMPRKISETMTGFTQSPQAMEMLGMAKSVGKEIALQKAGQMLIDSLWEIIQNNTKDLAVNHKAIRYMFHTPVGRAASTFVVVQLGIWGLMLAIQHCDSKGDTTSSAVLHVLARILMYSVGTSMVGALNIEDIIKDIIGWAGNICNKAGLDVDAMAKEIQTATATAKAA